MPSDFSPNAHQSLILCAIEFFNRTPSYPSKLTIVDLPFSQSRCSFEFDLDGIGEMRTVIPNSGLSLALLGCLFAEEDHFSLAFYRKSSESVM